MPTICVYSLAKKSAVKFALPPSRSVSLCRFFSSFFWFLFHSGPFQSIECGPGLFSAFCLHKVESQSEARRAGGAANVEPDKLNGQLRMHKEANSSEHPHFSAVLHSLCTFCALCLSKVNKTRASDRELAAD